MEELSNGNYILSGKYTKDLKIKECVFCGNYSPIQAKVCCGCGKEDLKLINGNEEIEKENLKLSRDTTKNIGIIVVGVLVFLLSISICYSSGGIGSIFIFISLFMLLWGIIGLKNPPYIKYHNSNDFLKYVSNQLERQLDFKPISKVKLNTNFDTKISNEAFIKLLNIWFDAYISPSIIRTRTKRYLKENGFLNCSQIDNFTKEYYSNVDRVTNTQASRTNGIFSEQNERISNIQTSGLDFGIITNRVSSAMIYNAMNEKEKKNQYNRQLSPILTSTNIKLKSALNTILCTKEESYNIYKTKLIKYVKEKMNAETEP